MAGPQMDVIGRVSRFFAAPSVAAVELTAPLAVGEIIFVKGHTTDFQQAVASMQVNHQPVSAAQVGQTVGVQMTARCRPHDLVYKLVA